MSDKAIGGLLAVALLAAVSLPTAYLATLSIRVQSRLGSNVAFGGAIVWFFGGLALIAAAIGSGS